MNSINLSDVDAKRFWGRVDKTDTCWFWKGVSDRNRYGTFTVKGVKTKAHRLAWSLHHGKEFPDGMLACHTCDTPACVNPLHIWPGTMRANIEDAFAKGRGVINKMPPRPFCKRGHAMTAENSIRHSAKGRNCKACRDMRNRARLRSKDALEKLGGRG